MEYYSALKRKEILTYSTVLMNLEDIKWNKPITKRQILYDSIYNEVFKIIDRKQDSGCQELGDRGMGSYCLMGIEFQFYRMNRITEMDAGDSGTLLTYLKLLNWTLKIRTSLVVQWLRICLAIQGMWVWFLVGEVRYHMLQDNWAHVPQLLSPYATTREKPASHNENLACCN